MKFTRKFPKTAAIAFALLMVVPALPSGAAEHVGQTLPSVPQLPHARPSDECITLGVPSEVAAGVANALNGDLSYLAQDEYGVPTLCTSGGQPSSEMQMLVRNADNILDQFRAVLATIQMQSEARLEYTLPGGSSTECTFLSNTAAKNEAENRTGENVVQPVGTAPLACDVLRPETTLLKDNFDGKRVGGFGDWTVVTEKGEPATLRPSTMTTSSGVQNVYRFGDSAGYERGVHQWLVSPELDLGALSYDPIAAQAAIAARDSARASLRTACDSNTGLLNTQGSRDGQSKSFTYFVCGTNAGNPTAGLFGLPDVVPIRGDQVVATYEAALDDALANMPLFKEAAKLDFTYRLNMASGTDGVRVWIYTGEKAPDRLELYNLGLYSPFRGYSSSISVGEAPGNEKCATDLVNSPLVRECKTVCTVGGTRQCTTSTTGAMIVHNGAMRPTSAFSDASKVSAPYFNEALTGDQVGLQSIHIDLTDVIPHRIWVIFEVRTQSAALSRGAFFEDRDIFPRGTDYGFELAGITAVGDGFHRNARVKDVAGEAPRISFGNLHGDPVSVRTTIPPGNEPVVIRVHNAGQYRENGTLDITFRDSTNGATIALGTRSIPIVNLSPSEVRNVPVSWGEILSGGVTEGHRYDVSAKFTVETARTRLTTNSTKLVQPDSIAVRTPNAAETDPFGYSPNKIVANATIRAYTRHLLTPVSLQGVAGGNPFLVCEPTDDDKCKSSFTAERGDPRKLLLGVRNDGSVRETATVTLVLDRDGNDASSTIVSEVAVVLRDLLPGEHRIVRWDLSPSETGIYRARAYLGLPGVAATPVVERLVYVQRTAGTLCFDNLADNRACGPSFSVTRPDILEGKTLTALGIRPDGIAYVTSAITNTSGALFQRGADGAWTQLADLSVPTLTSILGTREWTNDSYASIRDITFAPDGTIYLVGDNTTAISRSPSGALATLTPVSANATPSRWTTATWWNGTLYVGGTNGNLSRLNMSDKTLVNVTLPGVIAYEGSRVITDLVVTANNRMYVSSDSGRIYEAIADRALTLSRNTTQGSIVAMTTVGNTVYAVGNNVSVGALPQLLIKTGTSWFNATPPVTAQGRALVDVFAANDGQLFVRDSADVLATCAACTNTIDAKWTYPAVPLPLVVLPSGARPARMDNAETAGGVTLILAEGGNIIEFADKSPFNNQLDWTTVPAFAATGGGVIQTPYTKASVATTPRDKAYRSTAQTPDANGPWTVTMRHRVAAASNVDVVSVRLLAVGNYPTTSVISPPVQTCRDTNSSTCSVAYLDQKRFTAPTAGDGWITTSYQVKPTTTGQSLAAVEFYRQGAPLWAIDQIIVKNKNGETLFRFDGPNNPANVGTFAKVDVPQVDESSAGGWEQTREPFGVDTVSPWHISQALTDRPVWVANNEINPSNPGGSSPRLLTDVDGRLISPVFDLGEAFDPVVSFRHAFAFRTMLFNTSGLDYYRVGDAGIIEIQYRMTDQECLAAGLQSPCWSPFFKVRPENGYPNVTDIYGDAGRNIPPSTTIIDRTDNRVAVGPGQSFWGRSVTPNERGIIEGVRYVDSDNYKEVRVRLAELLCGPTVAQPCLPPIIIDREVRVGFKLIAVTSGQKLTNADEWQPEAVWNHTASGQAEFPTSYPGEGWYITDLKVLGAAPLGLDLRATNMTFPVGYAFDTIGVGPATRVPVNVTIENRGRYDVPGYTGELEVRRVTDPVTKRSEFVERISMSQQPVLKKEGSVNHTFFWNVPAGENAKYTLTFTVAPIGIDVDEDATDNKARLGTLAAPIVARTVPQFRVEFIVTPENATSDITRYVPIYLNNTGNVPLQDFTVKREISLLRGFTTVPAVRTWHTDQVLPAGTRMPLSSLSDGVDAATDLFWKAPERANYKFRVEASAGALLSATDRLVQAYATYLFDDVEAGPRGETTSGEWRFDPGWGVTAPGFLTPTSYGFGDPLTGRYPADADASARSPTVDLSGARSARVALFQRYDFEPRFDAGIVEASADGGRTWSALTPIADKLNKLEAGYDRTYAIAPSSALHPTGDPDQALFGITGSSCALATAIDCWVLTQYDLTSFKAITESDVRYAFFGSSALGGYGAVSGTRVPQAERTLFTGAATGPDRATLLNLSLYQSGSWAITPPGPYRSWFVENLSENDIRSVVGDSSFWWSGSMSLSDDAKQPAANYLLNIPVDLSSLAGDTKTVVVVDWWESLDRFGQSPVVYTSNGENRPFFKDMKQGYAWHPGSFASNNFRLNVTVPNVVERQGDWFHLQADITTWKGSPTFGLGFVYSPHTTAGVPDRYIHDRGWAIDGFTIRTYEVQNGQPTFHKVLLNETEAWSRSTVEKCAPYEGKAIDIPCFLKGEEPVTKVTYRYPTFQPAEYLNREIITTRTPGLTWARIDTSVPSVDAAWQVVPVKDKNGASTLPTGEATKAWYTGDTKCVGVNPCMRPGAESRLVTPSFDLSSIAGQTADLTFTHRYGFASYKGQPYRDPLASGGVVEIQEYDPQTDTWSPWKQLYNGLREEGETTRGAKALFKDGVPLRGGYTAYTVNVTSTSDGAYRRVESPFEPTFSKDRDVQFLYSGRSTEVAGCAPTTGWCDARFSLTPYLGKTVRFGFHVHMTGLDMAANSASLYTLANPDLRSPAAPAGGWWVADIAVVGDVLRGAPVELRFRAATDGNVHDGRWQIDDIGIFGSRYARNVAVFVGDGPIGVTAGDTATVPITIRNMGDSVRRGLALEVRRVGGVELSIQGTAPGGLTSENGVFLFRGYTLAPGQSATINMTVTAAKGIATSTANFLLVLKEFNSAQGEHVSIVGNEVEGFLTRQMVVNVERQGKIEFPQLRTSPATPLVGQPVDLTITARNTGFSPIGVDLRCSAESITGFSKVDHKTVADEAPSVARTYPCTTISTMGKLAPGQWANLTYRVIPTVEGYLRFTVDGKLLDGIDDAAIDPLRAVTPVGVSFVAFSENFTNGPTVQANWSPASGPTNPGDPPRPGPTPVAQRGNRQPGAMLLGASEAAAVAGGAMFDYTTACGGPGVGCQAQSPPIDLHNYTNEAIYLSFWHMDRFAKYDGGQVRVSILLDERFPARATSWSPPILIRPIGDYEGTTRAYADDPNRDDDSPDLNGGCTPAADGSECTSGKDFFISENGVWETTWSFAQFDLRQASHVDNGIRYNAIGHTVRFHFQTAMGSPAAYLQRGPGHGWLIDDVSVSPATIAIRPAEAQRALLVDNTTKAFNVLLHNGGSYTDLVKLSYDAGNSSAPKGAVIVPSEAIEVPAGQTVSVRVLVTLPRDPSLLPTRYVARLLAASVFDPNAAGKTDIEIDFDPRQWAELSLSVEAPKDAVQEGTEVFIPLLVENNGLVVSTPSKVRIIDSFPGLPDVITDLDLPAMSSFFLDAEDATRAIEFRWRPAKGALGMHTLTMIVDPDVRGEEYTRTNNVVVLKVPVTEVRIPDLDIASLESLRLRNLLGSTITPTRDGDVTRYEITEGELVTMDLRVLNRGRAAATNVDVRAFLGTLSLPPKTIPFIAAGSEVTISFNWLAQQAVEPYDLTFVVRSEQVELSTANNENPGRGVTRVTVKGYDIQVDLDKVLDIQRPGTTVEVPFRLTNTGNAGEEIRIIATSAGLGVTVERAEIFLRAGERYESTALVTISETATAGEQFISIEAVSRENPMKVASARTPVNVLASYGGALVPTDVRASPPVMTVPVKLTNLGNSLEPWTVNVRLPAGWTSHQALPMRVSVPAFGEKIVELRVTAPETTPPGGREVRVTATLPDGTELTADQIVDVRPLRTAFVQVAAEKAKPVDGALAYPVMVENRGNMKAPFELLLLDLPAGVTATVTPSRFELEPGARTVATLIVTPAPSVEAGRVAVRGYTLFNGVNPDTVEGRSNIQDLSVIVSRPDLRVGSLDVTPRSGVQPGERIQAKVSITNLGQAAVTEMPVHLFVDDYFIAETRVDLAPGERRDVVLNWTAAPGQHTITVVVDPYEDAVEASREDNTVSMLANVKGDAVAPGGVAAETGKGIPAPSLFGTLAALAAVALVMIPKRGSRRPPK